MRKAMRWGTVAMAVALATGACSDSGPGGGGSLTQAEKTALSNALTNSGALGGFGSFASFAVQTVGDIGKITAAASVQAAVRQSIDQALNLSVNGIASTSYDAVGFAIDYDYTLTAQNFQGWFLGVVGWNGISGTTVNELVVVGGGDITGSLPSTASGTIESGDLFAGYYAGGVDYFGITGSAAINSSSFSGSGQDCSSTVQGFTVTCQVQVGTMGGNFNFVATSQTQSSYTQAPVQFSGLPSVRLTITIVQN